MKKLTAFLCALALAPIVALAAEKFPDISHEELKKAIEDKKVTLIDVNGTNSYKAGHIPGAINFETEKSDLASKLPKDKDALIVAYCGNEQCGAYAAGAKKAKELGYTNVKHYSKGIAGWKKAGEKTEKDS
jgi:rhodanese-related sulfurtransferase